MKTTLLTAIIVAILTGYTAYQHGFYVGKLDAEANRNALVTAGFATPVHIDSEHATYFNE